MAGRVIFISYRRSDSQWAASRLYDTLTQIFPDERLFMDVDSINPGQDFVDVLEDQIGRCDIFLALIGPSWTDERNPDGGRRIDDARDFVRIEIATVLKRPETVVIPILLDGAQAPDESDLPDALKPLARRQFARLTHEGYRGEIERLIEAIRKTLELRPAAPAAPPRPPVLTPRRLGLAAVALVAAAAAGFGAWRATLPPDPSGLDDLAAFVECDACPEMIVIPAGRFTMGAPESEPNRRPQDGPPHAVAVPRFALARTEVTFAEWDACRAGGGCVDHNPASADGVRGDNPAWHMSYEDAQAYIAWLNDQVPGDPYRLPTEAEWEYAARAGATTAYPWGDAPDRAYANMGREVCCIGAAEGADKWIGPAPVAQFPANAFGLFDMAGNLAEWTEDAYYDSHAGAPTDGSARTSDRPRARRVIKGGAFDDRPWQVRPAARTSNDVTWRLKTYGFRPARDLQPQ